MQTRTTRIALALLLLSIPATIGAVEKIDSAWSDGHLVFRDKATRAAIVTIQDGTDGVAIAQPLTLSSHLGAASIVVTTGATTQTVGYLAITE